jgi:hypothetical protein
MMVRSAASLVAALSLFVLAASVQFAIPAAAEGATKEVSVPATLVISTANNPENLGACGTLVFYEWSDVPNTTSATVNFVKSGKPLSETAAAPGFHDDMSTQKPPRYAPPGRHWISVGWSYAAGGIEDGAKSALQERVRAEIPGRVRPDGDGRAHRDRRARRGAGMQVGQGDPEEALGGREEAQPPAWQCVDPAREEPVAAQAAQGEEAEEDRGQGC